MLKTNVEYRRVTVWLETDDPDYVAAFERDCKWDSPLLKLKKDKHDGQTQNSTR